MLTRPAGLTDAALAHAVERGWDVLVTSVCYRPVGFGSHHWEVSDAAGARWFITVDELGTAPEVARRALETAYRGARHLRDAGLDFVVAPIPTAAGRLLETVHPDFALALFPFVVGESSGWDEPRSTADWRRVLELLVEVHAAPVPEPSIAIDDFAIPCRAAITRSRALPDDARPGPYSIAARHLLADHRRTLDRMLDRYDELGAITHGSETRWVVTHGEPHPGNTLSTADGWVLVDWDTALIAPPERDLWWLDSADGSLSDDYEAATGYRPQRAFLDRYRLGWDLADLAVYATRFSEAHRDSADDRKSWSEMRRLVERLSN